MEKESMLAAMMFGASGGGLPDASTASAGDALSLDENKNPVWATPGGGGSSYDAIIKCTNANMFSNNASDYVWEVGSFDDLIDKIRAGNSVCAYAYGYESVYDDEEGWYTKNMRQLYFVGGGLTDLTDWYEMPHLTFASTTSTNVVDSVKYISAASLYISRANDDISMPLSYSYTSTSVRSS